MQQNIDVKIAMEIFVNSCKGVMDSTADIEQMKKETKIQDTWLAYQNIIGDYEFFTGIASDELSMLEFASTFSGMELEQFDEMTMDILGEFINWSNGSLIHNLGEKNISLDLLPQEVLKEHNLEQYAGVFVVPFTFNENTYKYVIAFKNKEDVVC